MVGGAEAIEESERSFIAINISNALIAQRIPQCEYGPITTIFRKPGFWYWPRIKVKRCSSLRCPNNSPCLARKTVTRDVWAICYKRFNCWGLFLWIPIGIKRICVVDELECECKKCSDIVDYRECVSTSPCPNETNLTSFCYWRPYKLPDKKDIDYFTIPRIWDILYYNSAESYHQRLLATYFARIWGCCDCCKITPCPYGQFFDRRICMCRCRPKNCPSPLVQDKSSCCCECPQKFDCGPHRKWNPHLCRCECKRFYCFPPRRLNQNTCDCECPPIYCRPPLQLDPSSCQCHCPKNIFIACPHGSYQDNCSCVGDCQLFNTQLTCMVVDSCSINKEQRCRWFPTFPQNKCQCECCQPRPQFTNANCELQFTYYTRDHCNAYIPQPYSLPTCQWVCP